MQETELAPLRFGVVGAGRLGRVVARALQLRGAQVVAVSSRSSDGRGHAASELGVPALADPAAVAEHADVVLICTPDDVIAEVAGTLAGNVGRGPTRRIVHMSGSVQLAALDPLREAGWDVLGLHPLQTITDASRPGDLADVPAAVTAHDDAGEAFGRVLARALGMRPFLLDDDVRALYHAASSVAANFTVTLQSIARDLATAAGMDEAVARQSFSRLARAAIDRVEHEGAAAALTGPIVRGDAGTVDAHRRAIEEHAPQHLTTYDVLAVATTGLAEATGRLGRERAAEMRDAIITATFEEAAHHAGH